MKQRIITGVVAGAGFLALLWLGGTLFSALLVVMGLVSFYEYMHIYKLNQTRLASWIGYIYVLYTIAPWEAWTGALPLPADHSIWIFMALLLLVTVLTKNQTSIHHIALIFVGALYIGYGFHFMEMTRSMEHGLYWSFLLFVCIWATDSGAYFSGWAFGKHLLWPSISPKKTVEGAVGAVVFSVVAAICFSIFSPDSLSFERAVLLGMLVSLVSQMGDLVESALKRAQNVKDSGGILPGHGGILDRVDSWLFVFPFVYVIMILT